jgi:hypothetical protein
VVIAEQNAADPLKYSVSTVAGASAGVAPVAARAARLDGDGFDDLAVTDGAVGGGAVDVLLNDGSGGFDAAAYALGGGAADPAGTLAIGCVDGDQAPEIAAVGGTGAATSLAVLPNAGDGTFGPARRAGPSRVRRRSHGRLRSVRSGWSGRRRGRRPRPRGPRSRRRTRRDRGEPQRG